MTRTLSSPQPTLTPKAIAPAVEAETKSDGDSYTGEIYLVLSRL